MSKLIADEALHEALADICRQHFPIATVTPENNDDIPQSKLMETMINHEVNKIIYRAVDQILFLFQDAQHQLLAELLDELPAKKLYNIEHENQFELSEFDGFNNCLDQVVSIIEHYLTKAEPEQGEKG